MDKVPWASSDFKAGALVGGAGATILILAVVVIFPAIRKGTVYDASHWKLNIRTPIQPMWMNLGFWYDDTRHYSACFISNINYPIGELRVATKLSVLTQHVPRF